MRERERERERTREREGVRWVVNRHRGRKDSERKGMRKKRKK